MGVKVSGENRAELVGLGRDFRKRPDVLVLLTTLLDDNRAGLPQGLLEAYRLRGDILDFV